MLITSFSFQIIKKMLDHNPKIRPSATNLLNSDLHDEGLEEICETSSSSEDYFENGYTFGDIKENDYESDYVSEAGSEIH